jgi:hypothetical protein
LFIGTTLLMPRGIIGTYIHWRSSHNETKDAAKNNTMPAPSPHAAE